MRILGTNETYQWCYRFTCACGLKLEGVQKDLRHDKDGEPEMVCPRCNRAKKIDRGDIPENILRSY